MAEGEDKFGVEIGARLRRRMQPRPRRPTAQGGGARRPRKSGKAERMGGGGGRREVGGSGTVGGSGSEPGIIP